MLTGMQYLKPKHYRQLFGLSMLISLLVLSCTDLKGEYGITNVDLGNGRSIEILASNDAEVSQSFYYQVRVDQKIIVSLFMICVGHDHGQLKFQTRLAKDGDLVGIFEQKHPEEMLALHEFKSNATWPGLLSDNISTEYKKSGALLLKELQAEHHNIQLRLADGRACE
jgi:hypothetical protein